RAIANEQDRGKSSRGRRGSTAGQGTHAQDAGITGELVRRELGSEAELKLARLQYAKALADVALEQSAADPVVTQLNAFGALYAESVELRVFLSSPAVSRQAKHGVIEKLLARLGANKIVRNFLFVLADK